MHYSRLSAGSCAAVLFAAAAGSGALAQAPTEVPSPRRAQGAVLKAPVPLTVSPVGEDLYLVAGEGGNVAAYVTDGGVLLVDNMFERNHADILAAVAMVTARPVRYVINTHQHDDHAGGDRLLLPIAEVIAHENVRANLTDIRQPYYEDTPGVPIGLPEITFADAFTVYPGGREVRAVHPGRGHTNGDVVVHFPALRTIHTGDLFLARRDDDDAAAAGTDPATPERPRGVNIYVDYAQGGSFAEWAATLDRVLELDFDTIIPGHGPVSTRADLVRFRADLEAMRERISALIRMGATKAQVVAVFENDYGWRATGCPPSPPTPGCLQYQQMDALIDELSP